jgi:CHRD domain
MRILTVNRKKYFRGTVVLAIAIAAAQSPKTFRARLAPVAIDAAMKATVTGSGSLTAVLTGSKLTVNGKFDGLRGPATVANIHQGPATGVRGPVILELSASKATSGAVSGSFDLTPEQVESLQKGKWYVQIHSEKAPDGNLWGWLLK